MNNASKLVRLRIGHKGNPEVLEMASEDACILQLTV